MFTFQSTLPVRGATLHSVIHNVCYPISIHAPRAGSDGAHRTRRKRKRNFNPRSPCGERPSKGRTPTIFGSFQSTLPVRGATPCARRETRVVQFQSTLPVRGATLSLGLSTHGLAISIHAPRAGSDQRRWVYLGQHTNFNPRSPCGERRRICTTRFCRDNFNPRSPCGERRKVLRSKDNGDDFNPRSPCGERPSQNLPCAGNTGFQSTLPVRGATWVDYTLDDLQAISIHAPRAGSDEDP